MMRLRNIPLACTALLSLAAQSAAQTPVTVQVGDGKVDGGNIEPYAFTWRQCTKAEGGWTDGGTLTERMSEVTEDGVVYLRHEQEAKPPDGSHSISVALFDRDTLGPVQVNARAYDSGGGERGAAHYELGPESYRGHRVRGGERQELAGRASSGMYHGMAFGLSLAALGPEALPAELPASMLSFDATYRVIATPAGTEELTIGGEPVTTRLVDAEWHHVESGDVYPPGPNASGGRYWVISNPPPGVPYVPRYQTDTYAVEFVQTVCPGASQ